MENVLTKFDAEDTDNIAKRWERWLNNLVRFFRIKKIADDKLKIDYLFLYGGSTLEDAYEPVNNHADKFDDVTDKLTAVFRPKLNTDLHVHQFREMLQYDDEPFDNFVNRVRDKAKLCEFDALLDKEMQRQIVKGCKSTRLKQQALSDHTMDLTKLIVLGKTVESVRKQLEEMSKPKHSGQDVNFSSEEEEEIKMLKRHLDDSYTSRQKQNQGQKFDKAAQNKLMEEGKCFRCGGYYPHKNEQCPAKDIQCYKCGNIGHFRRFCLTKDPSTNFKNAKTSSSKPHQKKTDTDMKLDKILKFLDANNHSSSEEDNQTWRITKRIRKIKPGLRPPEQIELDTNGSKIEYCIDTGSSSCNIIDFPTYQSLSNAPKIQRTTQKLFPYNGKMPIKTVGKVYLNITTNDNEVHRLKFIVTKGKGGNLVGCKSAIKMKLIKFLMPDNPLSNVNLKNELINLFPNVFADKIGMVKGHMAKLHIDKSIKPVKQKLRPIPVHLEDAIKKEIRNLEAQGKIEKVNGPTEWIASIVPVVKGTNSKGETEVRICTDSRDANQAIIRERYKMPTVNELVTKLTGAKVFSKFDLKKAYFQISLHKSSRFITAFNTPFGVYQWCCLNMGLCASSEIFQKIIEEILEGLPGQFSISDDLCVFGSSEEEHRQNVINVLERLNKVGVTVNKDKCSIGEPSMEFFGFHFSEAGMSLTEEKYKALLNAKDPINAKELRSLLGLAQYCERAAIANMAKLVEPLRKLLRKGIPFILTPELKETLQEFKRNIVKYAIGYFRKDWVNRLIIDASPFGLGLIHTQYNPKNLDQRHIVDLSSRTLSEVESKYHQTELEALALVWAIEKRHYYLYNCEFEVVTDNKAVQLIFGKPTSVQKGRIGRWGLRLLPYRYKVIHQEGANNIADYLSRHPCQAIRNEYEDEAEQHVNMIVKSSVPKAVKRSVIAKASRQDSRIQNAMVMLSGKKGKADPIFDKIKEELTVTRDGILLKSDRIVIPRSLQKIMVQIAHQGHQGIVKTKRLARRHIWFPRMDQLLENAVRDCKQCRINTKSTKLNPVQSTAMPLGPWRKLALDYYGPIWGKYVLVLIDYFSRYPLVKILGSTNAKTIIPYLDEVFALFGIPKSVKSDNGPPFNSWEFKAFCEENNIIHEKITPYWPRANGLVEAFMKNITKCVKNATETGRPFEEELRDFLRSYRATPHSSTKVSPNDLLFKGKPSTTKLPNSFGDDEIAKEARRNDAIAKKKQAANENRRGKASEHNLKIGQDVLLLQTVKGKATTIYDPKPYTITAINGSMVTINRSGRSLARDSSLLKPAQRQIDPTFIQDDIEEEPHAYERLRLEQLELNERQQAANEQRAQAAEAELPRAQQQQQQVSPAQSPNVQRRSARNKKEPERYGQFVNTVNMAEERSDYESAEDDGQLK